ncbi:DUF2642 domain-containing protein [Salinithrix halophila]|uniref:DUF2642 domain-containing protein n=1 Tax=Salinithrix halophila TaxID=1485204 RepID=A0ABV8JLT6_9BACL
MPPFEGPGFFQPMQPEGGRREGKGLFKLPFGRLRRRGRGILAQQMSELVGQRVQVETYVGKLEGDVVSIHPDHMILEKEERKYHVRWDAIIYVSPTEVL